MVNDRITSVKVSLVILPLQKPASDAKVLTGKQKPLSEVAFLFAEIQSAEGHEGVGYSYALRAGAPALYAHAKELAPELIGENPNDIQRIWSKLAWLGQSVGRSGVTAQAVAAFDVALWDLKAKRARLPLAQASRRAPGLRPVLQHLGRLPFHPRRRVDRQRRRLRSPPASAGSRSRWASPTGGWTSAVLPPSGRPWATDVPLMVDANQQWNRTTAIRMGLALEDHGLTWIEEPLDAYDADGHAELARRLATAIATGEMLTSTADHYELIRRGAVDFIQPDAPRVGGITPFLRIMALGEHARMDMAPHFAMEIHIHLSAAYELDAWVEHFDWLEPLFDERLEIRDGHMHVPSRPGLGFSISEQARSWTVTTDTFTENRLRAPQHSNA